MAIDVVQDAKYEEESCLTNLPENLENSDRYESMEKAVDNLEDALGSIIEAKDYLLEAINC